MSDFEAFKTAVNNKPTATDLLRSHYMAQGFRAHMDEPNVIARAYAIESLFDRHEKFVYDGDLIAGSIRGLWGSVLQADAAQDSRITDSYGQRDFFTNADHFAPAYDRLLATGIRGKVEQIDRSLARYAGDRKKAEFLTAARITMMAFSRLITAYADAAAAKGNTAVADTCRAVAWDAPHTFRQALQLVWFTHTAFIYEGRYAMALGRIDQYLYPFYEADRDAGTITQDEAQELLAFTFYKIQEHTYYGYGDTVNIAIGGVLPADGADSTNDLSFAVLRAVRQCNFPGPNLSARIHSGTPDAFLDECLRVIGTGLGYPALMNDDVNIPALQRVGYAVEDCRDYCMVGCIENFIQGKQPPWTDGRFNSPKYLELALNNGVSMLNGERLGPETGDAADMKTMDDVMDAFREQLRYGAAEYMMYFRNRNDRYNPEAYCQPFLSCFCEDCLGRGADINDGGALYPSVTAPGCMGIATVADSLAAIERRVFIEKSVTLPELCAALRSNYRDAENLRQMMLSAPKYGNNDPLTNQYARWFVDYHNELFSKYRTRDGGAVYIAIAANIQNIEAGAEVAATPDGRGSGEPLSDAASPTYGRDTEGPTTTLLSVSSPDYTKAACGTVLNQKYSPSMFTDPEKRAKLLSMIRTYFGLGGQEIQINAVSRDILIDAMDDPAPYRNLVVRVSGFSAYYVELGREVQEDILNRTEQG